MYRLYRAVLLRGQVSRGAPLSAERTVERRALLSYAAEEAGAPTPRLRAVVRVGPEASVLAHDHHEGTTLAQRDAGCTDTELRAIWDAVNVLHEHRVTHRSLTADRILFTADGQVMLLDPGDGDVAATDLQVRLDLAQLLAELALYVGPERSADLALEKAGADELVAVVPLLQRVGSGPLHPGGAAPPPRCPACSAPAAARRGPGSRWPRSSWSGSGCAPWSRWSRPSPRSTCSRASSPGRASAMSCRRRTRAGASSRWACRR